MVKKSTRQNFLIRFFGGLARFLDIRTGRKYRSKNRAKSPKNRFQTFSLKNALLN